MPIQLLDEGIRLKGPGDVVKYLLYQDRAWCQWERKCGMHALLDAITAQQFNCPEAGMWQPVCVRGLAWELMGIYSSAVKVCPYVYEHHLLMLMFPQLAGHVNLVGLSLY